MAEEKQSRIAPAIWEHKVTKKRANVHPWWELLPNTEIKDKDLEMPIPNQPWKWGMLIQVGWLLENEHGMWMGVGPKAEEAFNVIKKGEIINEVRADQNV
jgi:hypothetical protein